MVSTPKQERIGGYSGLISPVILLKKCYRFLFITVSNLYVQTEKIGPWVLSSFGNSGWNPADSMVKFGEFHEIRRISWPWNLADFMLNERTPTKWLNAVNFMKSGRFHYEIQQISLWNLADFMKSGRFHHEICWISWNSADFMKFGRFHENWWISWQILKNANLKM